MQKLTLLDYPGKTAATVFTPGCNLRCPFCQNSLLVVGEAQPNGGQAFPLMNEAELFALLERRHGLLDGVVISGGEPLLQPDLPAFCQRVHDRGFLVKLDTNGSLPQRLAPLLDAHLVDYVAMDVKAAPSHYDECTGVPQFPVKDVERSLALLAESGIPYELRTTVMRELHSADQLLELASWLSDAPAWFLQQFRESEGVLAGPGRFHAWPEDELAALLPQLAARCPAVKIRGAE